MLQVHLAEKDFFFVSRALDQHPPKWIAKERSAPEFQSFAWSGVAANVSGFKAHAIHHPDIDSVSNGVRALNRAPRIVLGHSEFSLLVGMPSNCSWIKQNARALQCREASAFRIPLV